MNKVKGKLAWAFLLMIWALLVVIGHADAEEISETELYAQAAVLMDAESGRVLYGKNEEQVLAMASTTKIMTCIVALENAELTETVEISSYAAGMPEVKLGIRKGEKYQLKDLLYSLMLESHNDAAVAIAEHVGKQLLAEKSEEPGMQSGNQNVPEEPEKWSTSEEILSISTADHTTEESKQAVAAFAGLMNEKAKELGCENTWFITPNGLDAEEMVQTQTGEMVEKFHSTTAQELAWIMSYCIMDSPKSAQFLEITQTSSYTFAGENGRSFSCYNHNAFLSMMSGAISGKTGFTNRAGYCYVGALERDGRTFVVALLACGWPYNKNYKWSDTRKLMEYGVENYFYRSFLGEETILDKKWLEPIPVLDGQTDGLDEQAYVSVEILKPEDEAQEDEVQEDMDDGGEASRTDAEPCSQLSGLLMKAGEEIAVEYSIKEVLEAPVEKGMSVGEVCYMVDGVTYRTEEIVTSEGIERKDWQWCLEQIFTRYLLFN